MANTLDSIGLNQIISLHLDCYSNRKISLILGIAPNTVNTYMQLFAASEYSLKQLLSFTTLQLSELFSSFTTVDTHRHNEPMLYFETVNKSSNHHGFTFLYHYCLIRKSLGAATSELDICQNDGPDSYFD